jgi:dihydrofolate reductase
LNVKASVFVGTSLDGFIARPNGEFDFLSPSGDVPHGYDEFIATVDAIVMGRNTFGTVNGMAEWPYGNKLVIVLTTRPLPSESRRETIELMEGTPHQITERLAARGIEHIYVDGGITVQRFLNAGLIDRLIVSRVPVIIGAGIPLFGPTDHDIALEHIATRTHATGLVQSEYALAR